MMRRSILFFMLVALVISMTGCFGCKKKVTDVTPVAPQAQQQQPGIGEHPTEFTPIDATAELGIIYFSFDKSDIRKDQMAKAEAAAKWLLANPGVKVLVEGHCDDRGTTEYNLALGNRRADTMQKFFISRGVKAENISTISKGKEEPAVQGHTEAAWSKNRRDQFKFLSQPPAK